MNRYVATLLFLISLALFGQTNRGGISGVVKDQTGAVVPGASVIVTNVGTNEARRMTSSNAGTFSVQDLDPVTYTVLVQAKGFKKPFRPMICGTSSMALTSTIFRSAAEER